MGLINQEVEESIIVNVIATVIILQQGHYFIELKSP